MSLPEGIWEGLPEPPEDLVTFLQDMDWDFSSLDWSTYIGMLNLANLPNTQAQAKATIKMLSVATRCAVSDLDTYPMLFQWKAHVLRVFMYRANMAGNPEVTDGENPGN